MQRSATSTSSALPLLALGLIALGAAYYHASAACAALGVVLLLLPCSVFWLLRRSLRGVRIVRFAPTSAFAGDQVVVRLSIQNGSRLPIFLPRVADVFRPDAHAVKDVIVPQRLEPHESIEVTYTGGCDLPRGIYQLGPTSVRVVDPWGWFRVKKTCGNEVPFKVYPQYEALGAREESGSSASPVVEEIARAALGDSTEFLAVREYRHGDPLRRIHWGLTAHRGFPVVREYAHKTVGDLCLFVDLYRYSLLGLGRGSSLEQAVRIIASVSSQALRRGFRVELQGQGKSRVAVPAAAGEAQQQAILDGLVGVRPDGNTPLHEVIRARRPELRAGTRILALVSPYLRQTPEFMTELHQLLQAGMKIILVLFEETTYRSLYEMSRPEQDLEAYMARARILGIDCFRVTCGVDLTTVFKGHSQRC